MGLQGVTITIDTSDVWVKVYNFKRRYKRGNPSKNAIKRLGRSCAHLIRQTIKITNDNE